MRVFELFIGALVLVVLASFVALIVRVSPTWVGKEGVFFGYLPGSGIVRGGGLYIATGIIGATVMPHAFFIGSKMATMRRLTPAQYGEEEEDDSAKAALPVSHSPRPHLHLPQPLSLGNFDLSSGDEPKITPTSPSVDRREKPSIACVRAHLSHSVLDVVGSLLGFATVINSAILILAAAVFYYGEGRSTNPDGVSDLFDAYDLVKQYLNQCMSQSLVNGEFKLMLSPLQLSQPSSPSHCSLLVNRLRSPSRSAVKSSARASLNGVPSHGYDVSSLVSSASSLLSPSPSPWVVRASTRS